MFTNGEASQHPGASADQIKWGEVRGCLLGRLTIAICACLRFAASSVFRLWRVASSEGPRSRGQEAVLLAIPPASARRKTARSIVG